MSDLNQCNFIGRLGKDPEIRELPSGDPVANFSIAVGEKWKDKHGDTQEKTTWINVKAFGKLAEIIEKYLTKGSRVFISGKLEIRKYEDKEGKDRYSTEIICNQMQMLDTKKDSEERRGGDSRDSRSSSREREQPRRQEPSKQQGDAFEDDDIPFNS